MSERTAARAVGARLKRKEDVRLLRGRGRYVADVALPGTLHAAIVRSPHAHARIVGIDAAAAERAPGVAAVLLPEEVAHVEPIPVRVHPLPQLVPFLQHPLAQGKVRYVGDPVTVVVADSRYAAEDAAELVEVEYEPLPAAIDAEAAASDGAPLLFEEQGTNVVATFAEDVGDVEAAFAEAELVVLDRFEIQRHGAVPLETRGLLAEYDTSSERLTVWGPTKVPHANRAVLAPMLGLPEERIRFVEPDVGGGFGARGEIYPEDVLVPLLAMRLGRPVKWIEDRRENLVATNHSREQVHETELALARDGTILGLRARLVNSMGGYVRTHGIRVPEISARIYPGPYRIPNFRCDVVCVLTNKTPGGTFRAPGRFEVNYVRERLVDMAARRLGLDPAEIRRRNFVRLDEMPYRTGTFDMGEPVIYETGDQVDVLERALDLAGYDGFEERRARGRRAGRRLGIGIGSYMEESGLGGLGSTPGEYARVAVDTSGRVTVYSGVAALGQGLETSLAQVCSDELGVPVDEITVVHGDTDRVPWGGGTWADRGAIIACSACLLAARKLRERVLAVGARLLEADEARLEDGRVVAPDGGSATFAEVARASFSHRLLAEGETPGLEESTVFHVAEHTYAPGTQVAVVEVDEESGRVDVLEYATAQDVGRAINPGIVEGQLVGGVAQGLGGALLEHFAYDELGQPLATSLMDYLLPSALESPPEHRVVAVDDYPSHLNPLGVRGVGDAGPAGAAAALANAVVDALADLDVRANRLPLSPERVLAEIGAARSAPDGNLG